MKSHNLDNSNSNEYNKDFIKEIISKFDLTSSILLIITSFTLLCFTPFLGSLIRTVASDAGYGSAKLFYFIVVDFEYYLILGIIFLIINAILLLLVGLGIRKSGRWSLIIHYVSWTMILIIFPVGTLYGAFTIWMTLKLKH